MGIKGLYRELGPGVRIPLAEFAIDVSRKYKRPLRLAIDISIWNFESQSGKGGSNPELRTVYYRLIRLLALSIRPIFVFDGPDKPLFKRNRQIKRGPTAISRSLKKLLDLFGFCYHVAPGEAEAECAILQRHGIVDAVLSEDVDTLMFGCDLTLRNWSSEDTRGNKPPTHVSMYDAAVIRSGQAGLDREGMILAALISGGDYLPEGIPGIGIKTACEAARAGFGRSLCALSSDDEDRFAGWRKNLSHELRTNESKFFRTKHKALIIPEDFPNRTILGYYMTPAVSSKEAINALEESICWNREPDIPRLRTFVAEAFEWRCRSGAIKFVRGLAPPLLAYKIGQRGRQLETSDKGESDDASDISKLIRGLTSDRRHFLTGGLHEIRVTFIPQEVVGLDLEAEEPDEEAQETDVPLTQEQSDEEEANESVKKRTALNKSPSYDASKPYRMWILADDVEAGAPKVFHDWESQRQASKQPSPKKAKGTRGISVIPTNQTRMDSFVRKTKPLARPTATKNAAPTITVTAQKVTQVVDLTSDVSDAGSDSLPALDKLMAAASPRTERPLERTRGLGKRAIMLRESLDGAWREVEPEIASSSQGWAGVEVIDMSQT